MPTRDIASSLRPLLALNANITSNTTTTGSIIDTADFDSGVFFSFLCAVFTDGSYAVQLFHGDDSGMSDEVAIPAANLIGSLPTLTAVNAAGAVIAKAGFFGTKRYVRAKVVSTGVTTGARIVSQVTMKGEILPVSTS